MNEASYGRKNRDVKYRAISYSTGRLLWEQMQRFSAKQATWLFIRMLIRKVA